ncbi:MAG: hypothetical protein DWQ06_07440 [Calditrichaeota bacterium]|nr:MAG: hypothetical protein DWQ06_07440 [Calditrichota bacterium]
MKKYLSILLILISLQLSFSKEPLVQAEKILKILETPASITSSQDNEIQFLEDKLFQQKVKKEKFDAFTTNALAGSFLAKFKEKNDPKDLLKAGKLLEEIRQKEPSFNRIYLNLYFYNSNIHNFKGASEAIENEIRLRGKNYLHAYAFDAFRELGEIEIAKKHLAKVEAKEDFFYLTRLAALQDFEGSGGKAFETMLKAEKILLNDKHKIYPKSNLAWCYFRLADLSGHTGNPKLAVEFLFKGLAIEVNAGLLDAIGWIVYKEDKNLELAHKIYETSLLWGAEPETYLMLSEIQRNLGKLEDSKKSEENFIFIAENSDEKLNGWFDRPLALIYSEDSNKINLALKLAKRDFERRPTRESFDCLSYVYLQKGDLKLAKEFSEKALKLSKEPSVLLHSAMISSKLNEAKSCEKWQMAFEEAYELTFSEVEEIQQQIDKCQN